LEPGNPARNQEVTGTEYWLASGSTRFEFERSVARPGKKPPASAGHISICSARDKSWVCIDTRTKSFSRHTTNPKNDSHLERLDLLGNFSGQADRELGMKEIGGKRARGFQINVEKIDASLSPGVAEIWIDSESHLPVLVCYELKLGGFPTTIRVADIQWNIDLDPKLFDPSPPKGYTDVTPKPLPLEKQVRQITEAFRYYSEASGERYPRRTKVGLIDLLELVKRLGIGTTSKEPQWAKMPAKLRDGFLQAQTINNENPDAAYYGKTVGPTDKDKVLLRWKLDDGRYEVIFGDLRSETVTADRLRKLEGT